MGGSVLIPFSACLHVMGVGVITAAQGTDLSEQELHQDSAEKIELRCRSAASTSSEAI